jgi:ATP-binding cassette subfamily F protein 3
VLAILVARRPNLLLLDEPTNHLDLEMRLALGMALQEYTGALIVVSHDRHLIRSIADELWLVHEGRVEPFAGDLDDYAGWLATTRAQSAAATPRAGAQSAEMRRAQKRVEAERRNRLSPLRARIRELEEELSRLGSEKQRIESALADPAIYASDARDSLRQQLDQQREIDRALSRAESQWLEASEALEAASRERD